jgi:hypothetical protein
MSAYLNRCDNFYAMSLIHMHEMSVFVVSNLSNEWQKQMWKHHVPIDAYLIDDEGNEIPLSKATRGDLELAYDMAEENEYEVVRGDFSIPRDFSTCECHADELNAIDEILKDREVE